MLKITLKSSCCIFRVYIVPNRKIIGSHRATIRYVAVAILEVKELLKVVILEGGFN